MNAERPAERPPYGRSGATTAEGQRPIDLSLPYQGTTYYDESPIKPSHYGWLVVAYFFVGGVASAAQFIATIADLIGGSRDRPIVRAGRHLALLGALISPALLISDLHTPRRWYNMMRIYRHTSAMSIGSWALSLFGAFSGLTSIGQVMEDVGLSAGVWIARLFQWPAALAGGVVSLYTGTLLAATNLPLLAGAFPYLSSLFASSAASTAAAALSMSAELGGASPSTRQRLNLLALITGLSELVFALMIRVRWQQRQVVGPVTEGKLAAAYNAGVLGLGISAPVALHGLQAMTGRLSRPMSLLAAASALAGGFILRAVFVFGGNASGRRPQDYFRLTSPDGKDGWLARAGVRR